MRLGIELWRSYWIICKGANEKYKEFKVFMPPADFSLTSRYQFEARRLAFLERTLHKIVLWNFRAWKRRFVLKMFCTTLVAVTH